jgi:hypothetical protein
VQEQLAAALGDTASAVGRCAALQQQLQVRDEFETDALFR